MSKKQSAKSSQKKEGPADDPSSAQAFWKLLKNGQSSHLLEMLFILGGDEGEEQRRPHAMELVNSRNDKGFSPLTYSVSLGHDADLCDLLIRAGAKINDTDGTRERNTPLLAAALVEDDILIQLFVKHHADMTKCDATGRNVLHVAARNGSRNLFSYFLREASPGEAVSVTNLLKQATDGTTPVHYALGEVAGCVAIAEETLEFLDSCEDKTVAARAMSATTKSLATPLHVLASSGVSNAVVAKIAAKAVTIGSPVWAEDDERNSPLHIAASTHSTSDVIGAILEVAGASSDDIARHFGANGYNLLHAAAANNRKVVLQLLLTKYAGNMSSIRLDIPTNDEEALTPAEVAIFAGHDSIADLLVQHGARDVRSAAKARRDAAVNDDDGEDAPEDAGGDYGGHGSTTFGASRVQAARKSKAKRRFAAASSLPGATRSHDNNDDGTPTDDDKDESISSDDEVGLGNKKIDKNVQAALEKRQQRAAEQRAADHGPSIWVKLFVGFIFLSTLIPLLDMLLGGGGAASRR